MEDDQPSFATRAERINHDMRTPIGTLVTALELIDCEADASAAETRSLMERQLARLTALAEELRELARDLASSSSSSS